MGSPMTKHAYKELINEDILWLEKNTDSSPEQAHIISVLKHSAESHCSSEGSVVETRLKQYLEYQEGLISEPEDAGYIARCNLITAIKELLDPKYV